MACLIYDFVLLGMESFPHPHLLYRTHLMKDAEALSSNAEALSFNAEALSFKAEALSFMAEALSFNAEASFLIEYPI
jgi:hypothetical protein